MTEEQLLEHIIELADSLGLLWHRCPDSRRCQSSRGFVDVLLVGRGGVIFAETKSRAGQLRPDQQTWKWTLIAGGQRWFLWRPADWDSGQIHADLRQIV